MSNHNTIQVLNGEKENYYNSDLKKDIKIDSPSKVKLESPRKSETFIKGDNFSTKSTPRYKKVDVKPIPITENFEFGIQEQTNITNDIASIDQTNILPSFLFTTIHSVDISPRKMSGRVLRKRPSELTQESSRKRRNDSPPSSPNKLLSRSNSRFTALKKTITKSVTQRTFNLSETELDLTYSISLETMLKNVIMDNQDSWKLFILSYVHFKWTPKLKFNALRRFYKTLADLTWMKRMISLKQKTKVLMYLSEWIQLSEATDFKFDQSNTDKTTGKVSLRQYRKFIEMVEKDGVNLSQINVRLPTVKDAESNMTQVPKNIVSRAHFNRSSLFRNKDFLNDASLFSHQLAVYEFQLFKKIQPQELVNQAWNRSGKEEMAPNITKFIKHFNTFSEWITTKILKSKNSKEQAKLIEKFVLIAKKSKNRGNFNGIMEIISSLLSVHVQQLSDSWKLVSEKYKSKLKKMESLMSPLQNFRNYRQKIEIYKGFLVPYVGVHLGDIVHLMEGYIETSQGFYDTQKVLQLGSYLVLWRSLQEQNIFTNEDVEFTKFLDQIS